MQAPFFLRYSAGGAVSSVPRNSSAIEYDVFLNNVAASRLGPMLRMQGISLPEHLSRDRISDCCPSEARAETVLQSVSQCLCEGIAWQGRSPEHSETQPHPHPAQRYCLSLGPQSCLPPAECTTRGCQGISAAGREYLSQQQRSMRFCPQYAASRWGKAILEPAFQKAAFSLV